MNISQQNYFEVFDLDESFQVDSILLSQAYKKLQAQYHPDKVINAENTVRVQALQISSIINDAFLTLSSPLKRASYLLTMHGVDPEENNQAHLGTDFLLNQIELRELLESLSSEENLDALDNFKQERELEVQGFLSEFEKFYNQAAYADAKPVYNKLQFLYKLLSEINAVEEALLDY